MNLKDYDWDELEEQFPKTEKNKNKKGDQSR